MPEAGKAPVEMSLQVSGIDSDLYQGVVAILCIVLECHVELQGTGEEAFHLHEPSDVQGESVEFLIGYGTGSIAGEVSFSERVLLVVQLEHSEEQVLEGLPDVEVVHGRFQSPQSLVEDGCGRGNSPPCIF